MKFSIDKTKQPDVSWDGFSCWVYNSGDDFSSASGLYIQLSGRHGKVKSQISDRVYLILSGKVKFDIDGKSIKAAKDDVIIVPKDTPYDYWNMDGSISELFLVHTPAYQHNQEVRFEKGETV